MGKASTSGTRRSDATHFLSADSKAATRRVKRVKRAGRAKTGTFVPKAEERKIFGANLRRVRLAMGYSVLAFSRVCKASAPYVSAVELGRINVSIDRMSAFAKAVGLSIIDLLQARFAADNKFGTNRQQARPGRPDGHAERIQAKDGWNPDG
ncbi:MAG: helix-turn-helix domain-containing protein [Acetobacteraceae bacterium]